MRAERQIEDTPATSLVTVGAQVCHVHFMTKCMSILSHYIKIIYIFMMIFIY